MKIVRTVKKPGRFPRRLSARAAVGDWICKAGGTGRQKYEGQKNTPENPCFVFFCQKASPARKHSSAIPRRSLWLKFSVDFNPAPSSQEAETYEL